MYLARIRVAGVGPLDDCTFTLFGDHDTTPRRMNVVLGGGAVGKTSLLSAIGTTRPGLVAAQPRSRTAKLSFAVADWLLGLDDPSRPHPLRLSSPNVTIEEPDDVGQMRKKEQALFDRKALDGGFLVVAFSGARWFSKSPLLLTAPERTVGRYDPRAAFVFDDATRADMTRETKQALSYPAIAATLGRSGLPCAVPVERLERLDVQLRDAVSVVTELCGYRYAGPDAQTLEPAFTGPSGETVLFDDLPQAARHLAALAALPVRGLYAAYPHLSPTTAEGVVLIDEAALHLSTAMARRLPGALREALPGVQWVLTTQSVELASGCEAGEVIALRRHPESARVTLHEGEEGVVH